MKFGISIYPHLLVGKKEKLTDYLITCKDSNIGFIFTTLINFKKENKDIIDIFKYLTSTAKEYGIKVYGDINNEVCKEFNLDENNTNDILKFFKDELLLSGLRFDEGIKKSTMANLSNNKGDFKIILNASSPLNELDDLINLKANCKNIIACWNFYPQRYTAVGINFFKSNQKYFQDKGVTTQAFVSINRNDVEGPWKYLDKLPTLEDHRDKDLEFQIKHFKSLNVDELIVSSQFLNNSEFGIIAQNIVDDKIALNVKISPSISATEEKILNDLDVHFVRPDLSEYIIRSTFSRIKYDGSKISPKKAKTYFYPGDILILNANAKNYAGELQIVIKQMKNDGIRNVVGKLLTDEIDILKELKPLDKFIIKSI